MAISGTAVILGAGTGVLAILFGARLAARTLAAGTAAPRTDGGETAGGLDKPDVAGVIALPPLIFLGFLLAATVLESVVPFSFLAAHAFARYLAGGALAVVGFVMIGMGMRRFASAGTNVPPTLPTTALVVDGIYRRTRNPLYLGATLMDLVSSPKEASPAAGSVSIRATRL